MRLESIEALPDAGLLLEHRRLRRLPHCVEGELWIAGRRWCFLLEDPWRDLLGVLGRAEPKVRGVTCIPAGIYRLAATFSPKFSKKTLEIREVPFFSGIRYHGGTHPGHSEGCPLLGTRWRGPGLMESSPHLTGALVDLLEASPGPHYTRVTDEFANHYPEAG